MMDLTGKRAYITGGSSGIGRAIARALLSEGVDVVLVARDRDRLTAVAEELSADELSAEDLSTRARIDAVRSRDGGGPTVSTVSLDVADSDAVAAALPKAVDELGEPDMLFNCAGVALPGYFESIPIRELRHTMGVNLEGTWNTVQALRPWLVARRGHIVNVASLGGLVGTFGYTSYAASKFAVIGFSEALRSELAPLGVSVSVLCPPDTDTPQLLAENLRKPPETAALSAGAGKLPPDMVATRCIRAMKRGTFLILVGAESRLVWGLKRFSPRLLFRIMDRTVRRQQRTDADRKGEVHG